MYNKEVDENERMVDEIYNKQTKLQIRTFATFLLFFAFGLMFSPMWFILMAVSLIRFIWSLKTDYYDNKVDELRSN